MHDLARRIAALSADQRALLEARLQQAELRPPEVLGILPRPDGTSHPLSPQQKRLWLTLQVAGGGAHYNESQAVGLAGTLDVRALARSLAEIERRHEVLRATFTEVAGEVRQQVRPPGLFVLPVGDLTALPEQRRRAVAGAIASRLAGHRFDLARGPLLRPLLLRLDAGDHLLLLTLHHLVCDGLSDAILVSELAALYPAFAAGRPSPLPELPVQYADFAHWRLTWERPEEVRRDLEHWRERLAGVWPALELPADRPRPPVPSHRGARHHFRIAAAAATALRSLAEKEEVTPFTVHAAAYAVLLHALSGQRDVLFATASSGRSHLELEPLIGFFIHTVPLRFDLTGNPSFTEVLGHVRQVSLQAFEHQEVSFERLIAELAPRRRDPRVPWLQASLTFQDAQLPRLEVAGLELELVALDPGIARFDLELAMIAEPQGLQGYLEYSTDLFAAETAARIVAAFQAVLPVVADDPAVRLDELKAVVEAEVRRSSSPAPERPRRPIRGARGGRATVSQGELVAVGPLAPGRRLPVLAEARVEGVDAAAWAGGQRQRLDSILLETGGVLLRGFAPTGLDGFEKLAAVLCGELMDYAERSTPRHEVEGRVYTSTEYPPDRTIPMHNESSYAHAWPRRILFRCEQPAASGGETPLADSRAVLRRIPGAVRQRFAAHGVMYVRNFGGGVDLPWQEVFQTTERQRVEEYCRRAGIELEWRGGDRLRTRQVRQAVLHHPRTGEAVWFNQAHLFHPSSLEPEVRRHLESACGPDGMPRDCRYGDGSAIDDEALAAVRQAYAAEEVAFPWRRGDVVVLDNLLVAHGRRPFTGARRVVVAMGDPMQEDPAS